LKKIVGNNDLFGAELINKIDGTCKNLFLREKYLDNMVHGKSGMLWLCENNTFSPAQNSAMIRNINEEVLEGVVTVYNRFFMK